MQNKKPINQAYQTRAERVLVKLPALIHVKAINHTILAEVTNLSTGGAKILIPPPMPETDWTVDKVVAIEIHFDTREWIEAKISPEKLWQTTPGPLTSKQTSVRWVEQQEDNQGISFGVEFKDLSDEKLKFLQSIVSYFSLLQKAGVQL